ncbi:MAG: tetratricopeptide repeat protein [Chloroflexi bacterium]|nr:tetratricopeptide repeat protein [Chloroflexota bacterium]
MIRGQRRIRSLVALWSAAVLLAACGLVDVRVEETLTPVPQPTATPFRQASASGGALSYGAEDDDSMVVRTVAYPHIVLGRNGAEIEPFEQTLLPQEYISANSGYGFRLRVDWRMLWLQDVHGTGRVTMETFVQPPWSSDYESWDWVSTEDREAWGPDFQNELLDSTLWLDTPGLYRVRAMVEVHTWIENVGERGSQAIFETQLLVLSVPPEGIPSSNEYFVPTFGDLESQGLFPDWRGWAFGPCAVTTDNETVTRLLDAACLSVEAGDLNAAAVNLQQTLDAEQNPRILATVRGQLGMLAAVNSQWNIAARNFREALNLWQAEDDAVGVAHSLHNLGTVLIWAGRSEEGDYWLNQANQLQNQIGDWIGGLFTAAQFSVYWNATDYAEYVVGEFNNRGLPQAEPLQAWLDAVKVDATATAAAERGDE